MSPSHWYVLVEEDVTVYQSFSSQDGDYFRRWRLASVENCEPGKEKARERALDVARSHVPEQRPLRGNGTPGRTVFRLDEDAWLVELRLGDWRAHFRVSVAEAVHVSEEVPEEPWTRSSSSSGEPGPIAGLFRRGR
ncbi:hypothetical protein ACFW3D_00565 [Streptomyces sp. NPDC058864]